MAAQGMLCVLADVVLLGIVDKDSGIKGYSVCLGTQQQECDLSEPKEVDRRASSITIPFRGEDKDKVLAAGKVYCRVRLPVCLHSTGSDEKWCEALCFQCLLDS